MKNSGGDRLTIAKNLKEEPLGKIAKTFAQYFQHWNIQLPLEDIETRRPGKILQQGWVIEYLFGSTEREEFLDFYAVHRMTNDRHVRIFASGRIEGLEAMQDSFGYPADADEATRRKAEEEFFAYNRAVSARVKAKGFFQED